MDVVATRLLQDGTVGLCVKTIDKNLALKTSSFHIPGPRSHKEGEKSHRNLPIWEMALAVQHKLRPNIHHWQEVEGDQLHMQTMKARETINLMGRNSSHHLFVLGPCTLRSP